MTFKTPGLLLAFSLVIGSGATAGDCISQVSSSSKDFSEFARHLVQPILVPFQSIRNNVCVTAKIDNADPVILIVDTGCSNSCLDVSVLQQLQDKSAVPSFTVANLRIGNLKLVAVPFRIRKLQAFHDRKQDRPIGILGEDILKHFRIIIDYSKQIITFENPDAPLVVGTQTVLKTRPALEKSGLLFDSILDGNVKLPCLFDTGAQVNLVPVALVKQALTSSPIPTGEMRGLSGLKVKTANMQFRSWQAGRFVKTNPVFSVTMPEASSKFDPGCVLKNQAFATVGTRMWGNSVVTLDYKNKQILIRSHTKL